MEPARLGSQVWSDCGPEAAEPVRTEQQWPDQAECPRETPQGAERVRPGGSRERSRGPFRPNGEAGPCPPGHRAVLVAVAWGRLAEAGGVRTATLATSISNCQSPSNQLGRPPAGSSPGSALSTCPALLKQTGRSKSGPRGDRTPPPGGWSPGPPLGRKPCDQWGRANPRG